MTIAETIDQLQQRLVALTADKTRRLEIEVRNQQCKPLPEPTGIEPTGIKIRHRAS